MLGTIVKAVRSIPDFVSRASRGNTTKRKPTKPGALGRDIGRAIFTVQLKMDPAGFATAISKVAAKAMDFMAWDTREKIVNSIMGNRKNPMNVFPKNKIDKRTGQFYKNSIARPYPKPPRPYTKPGDPIALQQVIFRDAKGTRSYIIVDGRNVAVPEKMVGPMAQSSVTMRGTPGVLEKGGTSRSYYRFIPTAKGTYRQEFLTAKKPPKPPKPVVKGRPIHKSSWAEVRAAAIANGNAGKRQPIKQAIDSTWKGPKSFNVRPRHYVRNAWLKVKNRSKRHLDNAMKSLPYYMRQNIRLKRSKTAVIKGSP